MKHCVLASVGVGNNNVDYNITFTAKDAKLYVSVLTLSGKDTQKLSKLLSKGLERSMYLNKHKPKSGKYRINEYIYFFQLKFAVVNRLFTLVYLNRENDLKRLKSRRYY